MDHDEATESESAPRIACAECSELHEAVCVYCDCGPCCCGCAPCANRFCGRNVIREDRCERCARCPAHCGCATCTSCSSRVDSDAYCGDCEQCHSCCECIHCARCGDACESTCGDCDRCSDCCECSEDRGVELTENPLTFHTPDRTQRKRNPSARHLSVEIEVAGLTHKDQGYRIDHVVDDWSASVVEDGSLPDEGFEINTAPAGGDLFVEQIQDFDAAFKHAGTKITNACGLHVHIDARDFSYYDIRRLVRVYARIEYALFDMVPGRRRTGTYSKPCGRIYLDAIEGAAGLVPRGHKMLKKSVFETLYPGNSERSYCSARRRKYESARYYALNLHSWLLRGTVECRLFNGTALADKIIPWGRMWAMILDWVATHTDTDAEALLARHTNPRAVLAELVGWDREIMRFASARWSEWAQTTDPINSDEAA